MDPESWQMTKESAMESAPASPLIAILSHVTKGQQWGLPARGTGYEPAGAGEGLSVEPNNPPPPPRTQTPDLLPKRLTRTGKQALISFSQPRRVSQRTGDCIQSLDTSIFAMTSLSTVLSSNVYPSDASGKRRNRILAPNDSIDLP